MVRCEVLCVELISSEQGAWLREVSRGPRPKTLVTGSPPYVDGEHHPCTIEGGGTVDEIVRDPDHHYPDHHYVAATGGDIHNYQRYPVQVDGRTIQYVVSGGGGAFMHATHTIPRVDIAHVSEKDFRCYPLRGDSLAFCSRLYGRRLHIRRFFTLTEAEATAVIAERLGIPPTRSAGTPARVTWRTRLVATLLGAGGRPDRTSRVRLPVRKIYTRRVRRRDRDRLGPRHVRAPQPRPEGTAGRVRGVAGEGAREVPVARLEAARRVRPSPASAAATAGSGRPGCW